MITNKKLYQVLIKSAKEALKKQKNDGSMPPGHNGPYFHPETPIRNTCHWLITFLKVYKITKEGQFLKASKNCVEYILSKKDKYNYHHRTFKGRDKCNGLIGPAWTMEALLVASEELDRADLSDVASEIFLLHAFDEKLGLWYRREIDGKVLSVDGTFNHQLWFAAVGSMFDKKKYPEIHKQIKVFIEKLDQNFDVYKNGLIWHFVTQNQFNFIGLKRFISKILNLTIKKEKSIHKAIGYHQFNMYAFAIIKESYPDISFWNSEKFQKALSFIENEEYKKGLKNNKYGFEYNVAGIEVAYVLSVFKKNSEKQQKHWIEAQFHRNYDFKKNMLCKNTDDPETLSARLCEATRLRDLDIDLKVVAKEKN
jgi:hypothetical protein